jgi:hypothetical protein
MLRRCCQGYHSTSGRPLPLHSKQLQAAGRAGIDSLAEAAPWSGDSLCLDQPGPLEEVVAVAPQAEQA